MAEVRKVLPCPFCGSDNLFVMSPTCTKTTPYNAADRAYPLVRCNTCSAEISGDNWDSLGASALAAWNRRAAGTADLPTITAKDLCALADECARESVVNPGHQLRQMAERLRRMAEVAELTVDVADVLRVLDTLPSSEQWMDDVRRGDLVFVTRSIAVAALKAKTDLAARLREMQAGQTAADQIAEGPQEAVAVADGSQPASSITVGGHRYGPDTTTNAGGRP